MMLMPKMTKDEINSCMMELATVEYRLKNSLSQFKKTIKNIGPKENKPEYYEKIDTLRINCEYMIINLHRLCEIHDSRIVWMLADLDKMKLEVALKPAWDKIGENQKKINLLWMALVDLKLLDSSGLPAQDCKQYTGVDPTRQFQGSVITCAHCGNLLCGGAVQESG